MSGLYLLLIGLQSCRPIALRVPNMSPILLSISLGRYSQVIYINPSYKDIF